MSQTWAFRTPDYACQPEQPGHFTFAPSLFVSADPDGWAANGALAHMAPEAHLVPPMHVLDLKAF